MIRTVLALVLAIAMAGCSIPSLHGIHTPETIRDDAGLAGLWADTGHEVVVRIDRPAEAEFEATIVAMPDDAKKTATPMSFDVRLVQLGETMFADLVLNKQERQAAMERHQTMVVRTHQFLKFAREGDTLRVWALDFEKVRDGLLDGSLPVAHAVLDDSDGSADLVLTATTAELQAFLRGRAGDERLWAGPAVLQRQK